MVPEFVKTGEEDFTFQIRRTSDCRCSERPRQGADARSVVSATHDATGAKWIAPNGISGSLRRVRVRQEHVGARVEVPGQHRSSRSSRIVSPGP